MRRLLVIVMIGFLAACGIAQEHCASAGAREVQTVGFTVADMDRSIDFFKRVLTFEKESDEEVAGAEFENAHGVFGARARVVRMKLGQEQIELTEYLAPSGRPIPPDMRATDQAFQHIAIVVSDMRKAYERLRQSRVKHASTGPQKLPEWNKNAAGIEAFYFRDPDGHFLEVISFPADKGDARWQDKTRLFLGIDHTAVVSKDTKRSLAFYRDALCLRVAGGSENYGTEQEHLNNVAGARLRITTLRAKKGPGIELLEYLAPREGKPAPQDTWGPDLWHWETRVAVANSAAAVEQASRRQGKRISPAGTGGPQREVLVRDPDGHGILLQSSMPQLAGQ